MEGTKAEFYTLTPDAVLAAAEAAGIEPTGSFLQLNSLENRVFSVEGEERERVVLKFYRPGRWSAAQILEEHRFLAELAEAGVPVCAPLRLGSADTSSGSLGSSDGILFAAWKREGGRIPDEFTDEMLFAAGKLIARIHRVGAGSGFRQRPPLDAENLVRKPLAGMLERGDIPSDLRERYTDCALRVARAIDERTAAAPRLRIHGDFHWGNLLWDGKELRVLDFDDCAEGPPVQDIWMIAPAVDGRGKEQRLILLEGYRTVAPFEESWLGAASALRAGRFVDYAAWIAERRDDPAFKNAFPDFGTEEYWEKETADLESILLAEFERAEVPERVLKEYEEASTLTNKDYFFDL